MAGEIKLNNVSIATENAGTVTINNATLGNTMVLGTNASPIANNLVFANGNGIDFSAAAGSAAGSSSSLLDDYEEGTWTPTITGGTVTGGTVTGSYTKAGSLISLTAEFFGVTISSVSGFSYIAGFPFSSASTSVGNMAHCTMTSIGQSRIGNGSTSALLTPLNSTGSTSQWNSGSNKYMTFQITYFAS